MCVGRYEEGGVDLRKRRCWVWRKDGVQERRKVISFEEMNEDVRFLEEVRKTLLKPGKDCAASLYAEVQVVCRRNLE